MKKPVGRPPKTGPKLVRVYAAVLPKTRDLIDKAVAENGIREDRDRSKWIADAILTKLRKLNAVKKKLATS